MTITKSGKPKRACSGIWVNRPGHGENVRFWECCSGARREELVMLMGSDGGESLKGKGTLGAADVRHRRFKRTDSKGSPNDLIAPPVIEFPVHSGCRNFSSKARQALKTFGDSLRFEMLSENTVGDIADRLPGFTALEPLRSESYY